MNYPSIIDAKFPPLYEQAREALKRCCRIRTRNHVKFFAAYEAACKAVEAAYAVDECAAWPDKTAALASYMKQADDDEPIRMILRLRRRMAREARRLQDELANPPLTEAEITANGEAALRWFHEKFGGESR